VKFTSLLASSSVEDKASYSFRLLDHQQKGYVDEQDIGLMMLSLFEMWNILTGSKLYLLPEYIDRVMSILDANNDKHIELSEYIELYTSEHLVFPWWDWFNQGNFSFD
jgi:Ca2+-binding EF-hand superfamily protein